MMQQSCFYVISVVVIVLVFNRVLSEILPVPGAGPIANDSLHEIESLIDVIAKCDNESALIGV